ncbi:PD-(D/E)XK nuclease family protein [Fusobacterium simiae]|uniref:PD-(D/E)XK nuclease family protein n=1 Tax=Fusobacterium simiae TaxID=855 RepID=A0ABT4DEX5_FUSSI|nr:PD-(D/E)XK nuclease family protein [Fusobacterium simiae]MCY7007149.1 PD-(D/E)XK nuclease family protein [Fusobacterium simiae]
MNKLIFNYLTYNNQNQNELYSKIDKILNGDNSNDVLVVVESGMAQKHYFAYVNRGKLLVKNNIISFEDFLDKIFISNKKVLRDIKRFFLFYSCLNDDIKKKLNISNYFECIEIADDFFEFFSYIKNKDMLKFLNLSKWQKEKFEIFFEIKEEMNKFLDKNSYIPADWLYTLENLDLTFIKKYKKIIFYDVVDFPHNFLEIINNIQSICDVEIILQMGNKDFDMENLKLNKVTLPDKEINVKLSKYTNDLELHTMIITNQYDGYFSTDLNKEDKYSIFTKSNKFYLNDTKFYQVIETYLNLLNGVDYRNKKYIDIFLVKENIFKNAFMSFYGLDIEDYRYFENIISNDYRYISLELLNDEYLYYLKDNENLKIKLKLIFETLNEIEKIKDINSLNNFLCNKFFSSKTDIDFFMEDKFDTLYDKIYEILGLLNSNENIEFFKNLNNFFKSNLGKNIFTLFFNYLNRIVIYSIQKNKNKENDLKDLNLIKYSIRNMDNPAIIYADSQTLPKIKANNNLFTEQQKIKLGLQTNEDEFLIQKYRFFQNLLSLNKIDIYSMVDSDNNIDFSAFIYEFINKYSALENNTNNLKEFFKAIYLKEKTDNFKKDETFFRAYSKKKTDFKDNQLKIGAYDYMELKKNETFFFLDKICGIESSDEMIADIGISAKILGIILHKTLEKIFKENWKNILKSSENLLISKEVIEEHLKTNIWKEELKIESFMTNYIKEVIIPRFVSNIEKFFKVLYEELKDKKILRIEAEKGAKIENKAYFKYDEIEVLLNGRADLLIETDKARYIIDFKTGSYKDAQLIFYAIMFYGSDNSLPIYSTAYNFWDEQEAKNFKFEKHLIDDLAEKDSQFKELLTEFFKSNYYVLPKKSALKESAYDFNEYYRYKNIIPLEKMTGDEDE